MVKRSGSLSQSFEESEIVFGGSIARGAVPEGVSQSSAVAKLDLVSRTR